MPWRWQRPSPPVPPPQQRADRFFHLGHFRLGYIHLGHTRLGCTCCHKAHPPENRLWQALHINLDVPLGYGRHEAEKFTPLVIVIEPLHFAQQTVFDDVIGRQMVECLGNQLVPKT